MAALSKIYTSDPNRSSSAPSGVDPQQWSANPYSNFDYKHTWWQKLWEGLGFRSKFDEYRDSLALNSREYDSQLLEKAHNEQYDSALEQVSRQRQAGINPDLAGNVDAGSSSGMEPDPNAPISPGFNDPGPIFEQFGNMLISGFTSAIGLSNSIIGMLANVEDVFSKRQSNRNSVIDSAIDWAMRNIPDVYPVGDTTGATGLFHNENLLPDSAEDYALSSGFRKKDARLFARTVKDFISSAPGSAEAYKAWYERGKARNDWNQMYGSSLWSESDETLRDVLDPLIQASDRIRKLAPEIQEKQLNAEGAEADYNKVYAESADPALAGEVFNKTNERNKASADIDSILNQCMDQIISNLRDTSESGKRGHNFATAALLIFSVLRMTNFSHTTGIQSGKPVNTTSFGF